MVPTHALRCAARATLVTLFPLAMLLTAAETVSSQPSALRFEVQFRRAPTTEAGGPQLLDAQPRSGRLLVVLGKPETSEPRLSVGETGNSTSPLLGRDVASLTTDAVVVLDDHSVVFPIDEPEPAPTRNIRGPGASCTPTST